MSSTTTVQNATYTLSVIGPLTTTFTPPTSCFSTLFQTTSNAIVLAPWALTGCYPPGFSAAFATASTSLAYYSPGVCPSGYYHATPVSDWLLRADETGVHCCPSGFTFPSMTAGIGSTCTSAITTSTFLIDGTRTAAVSTGVVWAPAIAVVWTPGANVTPTRGRRRLAIAIVVPVLVLGLLAVALLVYWRRRRGSMAHIFPQLAATERHELQADMKPPTGGHTRVRELPASSVEVTAGPSRVV